MRQNNATIGIVGAGIGGLAVAAMLTQRGFKVRVFEQATKFARVGAGIQMAPNPVRVLRGVGLEDRLRKVAFQPETLLNRVHDTGEVTNEVQAGKALEERLGAPYLAMHRADLHALLADAVPAGIVEFNRKLTGVTQNDASVTISFADGATATVDALIGADGVHSVVRDIILGEEAPTFSGRVAYRAVFPATLLGDDQINLSRTKWWGPDRHIVIYYVTAARDEIYFVTSQPEDASWMTPESWSTKGDMNVLRAAFATFNPEVLKVLNACPEAYKWALMERDPFTHWVEGRIALLGDACHPMPPYMAQGAAMALEDAAVLARCLAGVESGGFNAAFRRFEVNRKPRATEIQQRSRVNTWLQQKTSTDWVYGYDAWNVPLIDEADAPAKIAS
jgi:2-polyprenyl-6-methoxyphenol hydroxylase-like FAD-dependent oxidoreductase